MSTSTESVHQTPASSSLPSPPFIPVPGVPNFRDLGGYPTIHSPSHSIRTNLIYRCGEPSRVTKDGISKMQGLGITHAYDLRSQPEIERAKSAGYGEVTEWEGCERVFVPVFREQDYSPEGVASRYKAYASSGSEGFTVAYMEIMENAPPSYRVILRHLANEPEKPLIIHCTAGKDRTGVLCALILSLCGVDDETIANEYSLTEVGLSVEWKKTVIAHLMQNPVLKGNEEGAWNLISAKAENMTAFLKVMNEKFGGAETYVIEKCGLSKEVVEKIRGNLLVEKPALLVKLKAYRSFG